MEFWQIKGGEGTIHRDFISEIQRSKTTYKIYLDKEECS